MNRMCVCVCVCECECVCVCVCDCAYVSACACECTRSAFCILARWDEVQSRQSDNVAQPQPQPHLETWRILFRVWRAALVDATMRVSRYIYERPRTHGALPWLIDLWTTGWRMKGRFAYTPVTPGRLE